MVCDALTPVSCNVHVGSFLCFLTQTQARDVGALLRACPSYQIQSVRGFDFFPQTQYVLCFSFSHVEGVCVLHNADYAS